MAKFTLIDETAYPLDTLKEIETAEQALRDAGHTSAAVYVGDPGCPDAYRLRDETLHLPATAPEGVDSDDGARAVASIYARD